MAKRIKILPTPDLSQPLSPELLGQAIKARRTQSKLRLKDAAALCYVAKDTLMKIEHGNSSCQLSSLLQICDSLGMKLFIQPCQETEEANDGWY
jgi:transcriptional regulator with XRE-family HTH domain